MTSKYMSRCFPHGFDVKRFRHLPRVFSRKDIVCTIWDQMIFVGFSRRIKPAVKPLTRRHYTGNGDVFRQILIDIFLKFLRLHRLIVCYVEIGNLCQCVNPRVRTACTVNFNISSKPSGKYGFQFSLNRVAGRRLSLPATIPCFSCI